MLGQKLIPELVSTFGQYPWVQRHASEMRPENEETVILEDNEMKERLNIACLDLFPNAYPDKAEIYHYYNDVGEERTTQPADILVHKPHLFYKYMFLL